MSTDSSISREHYTTDLNNNDIDMGNSSYIQIPTSKVVIPTSILRKSKKIKKHKQNNKKNPDNQFIRIKRGRGDKENNSIDQYSNCNNKKRKNSSHHNTDWNNSNNSNCNINNESSDLIDIYSYVTKTDRQKIMMRIEVPQTEDKLVINQNYQSLRKDIWSFCITHEPCSTIKNIGGKLSIEISVMKDNYNDNNNSQDKSLSINDFEMIEFDIDFNINIINHKSSTFQLQDITYLSLHKEEVIIPQEIYSLYRKAENSNVIALIELSISKKYNHFFERQNTSFSHTGIINEGATCYMNSMLQTLNAISSFKKAVFQIPTEKDDYNSIVLSLQRLFYDLMKNGSLSSTKILLQSFGWTKEQIQIQHDVQEFNLLLSEVMEKKMTGTQCEGFYNKLFEGKLKNYIQCVNVDYKSERIEKFNDIQLTIKGNRNIYESLNAYTEEEILDNDDKYDADGYGKQKAKKGIKFISFPSVLTLLLKRFEYNSKKEMMVKINDYFEYYEEINLKKYLYQGSKDDYGYHYNNNNNNGKDKDKDNEDDYIYTLHSVVVHQGNANSGHYYAYIKPTTSNFWILYNDDIVRPADSYELFNQNFGGNYQMYKHKGKGDIVLNNVFFERSAYILVYIKKSDEKCIMEPVTAEAVPLYLRKRFENEKEEELQEQKKNKRNSENVNVLLFSKQNCFGHMNKLGIINSFLDLNSDLPFIYNQSNRMLLSFPKQITVEVFLLFISQQTNIPMSNMLLFEYNNSEMFSVTSRQEFELLPFNDEVLKTATLIDYKTNNKKQYICFYLYVYEPYELFTSMSSNTINDNDKEIIAEYEYGDNKIVYIPKQYNQLCFKYNKVTETKKNNITSALDTRIIFVKRYNRNNNSLSIVLNFNIIYNPNKDINYHYNQIIDGINKQRGSNTTSSTNKDKPYQFNSPYTYLIEKASLCNWKNYSSFELSSDNINDIFLDNNSLIIIPIESNYTYEEVVSYINELNSIFYIDIYSIYGIKLLKKLQVCLKPKMDEYYLKEIIVNQIKKKSLIHLMTRLKDHYYINNLGKMIQITDKYLIESMSIENINLIDPCDGAHKQTAEVKEYPLLAYFNQAECKFTISFSLYQLSQLNDYYYQDIYLYDSNNNELCFISSIIPKKVKRCAEILDYIFAPIYSRFPLGFNKHNYYFILQNQAREYIYQIITDHNKELKIYDNKAKDIEYRLQAFEDSERNKFDSNEYKKVFLNFIPFQKIKIDPMVIYLHKNATFFHIKNDISDLVMKINKFNLIKEQSEAILIQITRGRMKDRKMIKDIREGIKDDDSLEYIFKDNSGVLNFIIEFVQYPGVND